MTIATGIGSWPGTDPAAAERAVQTQLAEGQLPFLPELPGRGPGADLIGRGAALLVDLPVELTPSGWRHADAPGRDAGRAVGFLSADLDELAAAYDGYAGPLKLQVTGPWTLAASVELPRGERTLTDPGAVADVVASLAEGVRRHVALVARLVPAAQLRVQVDEPSLPAVLAGRLPTASGYGRVRSVDPQVVEAGLRTVLEAAAAYEPLVHCCDAGVPLPLLRRAGARGVALDTALLTAAGWESVATCVEDGMTLYAGVVPTGSMPSRTRAVEMLTGAWSRLGLEVRRLGDVVVTPSCGLAGLSPAGARAALRTACEVADALSERADS